MISKCVYIYLKDNINELYVKLYNSFEFVSCSD